MHLKVSRFLLLSVIVLLGARAQAQSTTVTFDNPAPGGGADSYLNGVYQGINFGTSQWRWSGPYASDNTNHVYFGSASGTSRTFTFSPAPRVLESVSVYTTRAGTLTLSDGINTPVTRAITVGSMQTVVTGWIQGSTTVTVAFTTGWDLGLDNIQHRPFSAQPDSTPPTVAITAPAGGATVAGLQAVNASAADNIGVAGVQFYVDGNPFGTEDTMSPYSVSWDTVAAANGMHSLSAVARDVSGLTTTSAAVAVTVNNQAQPPSGGTALRFYANGVNDIDRVKIRLDDPATNVPGPPADVGATDFTLEFWMNALAADNNAGAVQCDNNAWIMGHILFDRDRYSQDRSFGISIAGGRLMFGVTGAGTAAQTICGTSNVLDGQWHHVAVQRRRSDGWLWIYVDGSLQAQVDGPDGDISYPDNAVPMSLCGPQRNQPCTNSDPFLVIGKEKHDAGAISRPYSGLIDEVHISTVLRYSGTTFGRPTRAFTPDASSVALYHFDEGEDDFIADSSGAFNGPSDGARRFGGTPAGPAWVSTTPFSGPGAGQAGQWAGPFSWPLVSIHMALVRTGEVVMWDGETYADFAGPSVRLWNPSTGVATAVPNDRTNIFCSGHSFLPDGRLLVSGGNVVLYEGLRDTEIFDPVARVWIQGPAMSSVRWYPSTVTLSDGRILSVSGSTNCYRCISDIPEVYSPTTNTWTRLPSAQLDMPMYPFLFQLPDGRVLFAASDSRPVPTLALDMSTLTWTTIDATPREGGSAAMYLPGRIMKTGSAADLEGGVAPSVRDTYVIDMTAQNPAWRSTEPMEFPRDHHNVTILADGKVLVTGGGRTTDGVDLGQAVMEAELWSPSSETWDTMAAAHVGRLYHSTALLLPDGRVLSAGGGRVDGLPIDQFNAEIYSPPYLFRGARPLISSAPAQVAVGSSEFVGTPDGTSIARVTLLAPGAVTHQVNMHQRFVELTFTTTTGGLNVQFPNNTNVTPPGIYMLFLINNNGVPSLAAFLSVGGQAQPLPVPAISSLTPSSTTAGSGALTLTVDGSNFAPSSVVRWNGANLTTAFVSATRLTAQVTAANVASGTTVPVTVFSPAPGGGTSNSQTFTVNNPAPVTSGLSPGSAIVGSAGLTLTVNGSGFVPTSVVRWNGSDRATTFVSATQVRATIPASDVAAIGTAQVTVFNATPQGGLSGAQVFSIQYPVPSVASLAPNTVVEGGGGLVLTVNGSNFIASSVVRWSGTDRPTSFISATQLSITLAAADVASAGNATVTVFNPAPGGGLSNGSTFTITLAGGGGNPQPAIAGINPTSAAAGSAGFALTVTGSNFVAGSVVRWNGVDRATMFGSATQLTAQILASDLTSAASAQVSVFSPAPGGGSSTALTFTVTAVTPTVGLVAAYNFNQGTGTQLTDISGLGNHGAITGATWTTSGRNGSALQFNGTSNLVTVPDTNALDLTTNMTLEAWVYPTVAPTGWRTIIAKEMTGNVTYYLHACTSSSNRPATGARIGSVDQVLYGGTRLTANTWVHVAATYDGAMQRLFINGVQVASRAQTGAMTVSTGAVRIGGNQMFGEYFQGRIDDLRIYNRALSAAEITADMNTPVGP